MTVQRVFEVGGAVRDALLGVNSKDRDFAVEADSFDAMRTWLTSQGFEVFKEDEQFLVIRARFPRNHAEFGRMTADFVLCRKDGFSSDSRRPDSVEVGTIFDDLARRDFTVNAMARLAFANGHWTNPQSSAAVFLDPHNGQFDLMRRQLRFVGVPNERLAEDALRALRAVRFAVTKGFAMDGLTFHSIRYMDRDLLAAVTTERVREELHKAFHHDTVATIRLLEQLELLDVFNGRLWLEPTMKS